MTNTLRYASIFAAIVLAIALVACGGGKKKGGDNAGDNGNASSQLPPKPEPGTGAVSLNSVGSDTLNNLMTRWIEVYTRNHPNVNIQHEGKGSSTAPPALIAGASQFGPMSREMKQSEIDAFVEEYNYEPTKVAVAIDALAVFVHKDNPIESLSIAQLERVFAKVANPISTWGEIGVSGPLADRPISLYGRNSSSGTYGYFKKHACNKNDYKDTVKEQPGSAGVVNGVGSEAAAIGYSGVGYTTSDVRMVALSRESGSTAYDPNAQNAVSGNYPLARFLYIYVNQEPGQWLNADTQAFIDFILSSEGQQIVSDEGFFALPGTVVEQQTRALQPAMQN